MSLDRIYPAISYPVSRGTPMIAPLIKWDHSQDWFVAEYDMNSTAITSERKITVELKSEDQKYMAGHIIDGEIDSFSNFWNFKMIFFLHYF